MSDSIVTGSVVRLGDFVSADVVLPARYSFLPPVQMAEYVLGELGVEVNAAVRTNSVIVAGAAFGYGTGRESPARALYAAGIRAVIARSFSRMFYRNAINNGIVVIESPELADSDISDGDLLQLCPSKGWIRYAEREIRVTPLPEAVGRILHAGGLVALGRQILGSAEESV